MRWVMVAIATAAFAGAVWWGVRRESTAPEVPDATGIREDSSSAPMEEASAPALATQGATHRPGQGAKGRAAIVGLVRQAGRPVSAQVEVRLLHEIKEGMSSTRRGMQWFESALAAPVASSEPLAITRAGEDGRFLVEGLAPGTYDVFAVAKGVGRGSTAVTLPVDGGRVEANVSVSSGAETLHGRIVHKDGRPWQGQVVVERIRTNRGYDSGGGSRGQVCAVDAEGRFVATDLETGTVSVTAIVVGSFRAVATGVPVPFVGEYVLTVDAASVLARGRVLSEEDGAPIAGASVLSVSWGRGADLSGCMARVTSDAQGRFEVPIVPTLGGNLYVMATGFAPTSRSGIVPKEGQPVEIRLVRGATIVGRAIRQVDGGPVAGVQVLAVSIGGEGSFPADPVTTDGAGHFEIADLGPGDAMVYGQGAGHYTEGQREASEEGYNPLVVSLESGKTTSVELRMVAGVRITGTVVDSIGGRVSGAVVAASGERSARGIAASPPSTASAADGSFTIDSLLPGLAVTFTADAPGFATARAGPITLPDSEPQSVELRFAADRRVEILVLDDGAGTPISGARVSGWVSAPSGGTQIPAAWTGTDGKVMLGPVPPGQASLTVEADGYAKGSNTRLPEGDTALTIRVPKGLDVVGRVLMPDQSPAAGVAVTLHPMGGRVGWANPETTAADGSFRFHGLGAGSVVLTATLTRDSKSWNATLRTDVGAKDVQILLVAPDGKAASYALNVHVVDAGGSPVPRAQVRFTSGRSSNGSGLVDGRATFQVGSDRANMTVEVWAARGNDGQPLPLGPTKVTVADGVTDVEIRMVAESSIDGVVKTKDGVAVKGALVQAFLATKGGRPQASDFNAVSSGRTDVDGKFRLGGLGAEDYTLSVQPPTEFSPLTGVAVKGGSSGVELVVRGGTNVTITVLDPEGNPVAGANVSAVLQSDMRQRWRGGGTQQTDTKGQARFLGLDASAAYQLSVSLGRDDLSRESRDDWRPVDETIRLKRVYAVRGVVRDVGGRPVSGASVQWKAVGAAEEEGWNGTGSQEDGTFQLGGLPAGQLVLRASIDDETAASATQTTVVAGAKDVVLTADVGLELSVRIENWPTEGSRRGSAYLISVQDGNTRSRGESISSTGIVKFRGLKSGTEYTLWVPPVAEGLSCLRSGLRPGPELAVRLVPGKSITGRVVVPEGATRVSVSAQQDSMALGNGIAVGADGRFEIKGLPDGKWKIHVWARSKEGGKSYSANGEAAAGGTIELELKEPK